MNAWQLARHLRHVLLGATWPDGSAAAVLASVHVTPADADNVALTELRLPCALIHVGGSESDDEEPGLVSQEFEVEIVQAVAGDTVGQRATIGGPRSSGQGTSLGRGVLEIEEEVLTDIQDANETNGITMRLRSRSSVSGEFTDGIGYVTRRILRLEALCTTSRFYAPGRSISATNNGGGSVTISWTNPANRYDFHAAVTYGDSVDRQAHGTMVLRRAAGATAPSSATAGTGVTLSSAFATSVTDIPGAGQFSYALFAGYDETGSLSAERYSSSVTVTQTVT